MLKLYRKLTPMQDCVLHNPACYAIILFVTGGNFAPAREKNRFELRRLEMEILKSISFEAKVVIGFMALAIAVMLVLRERVISNRRKAICSKLITLALSRAQTGEFRKSDAWRDLERFLSGYGEKKWASWQCLTWAQVEEEIGGWQLLTTWLIALQCYGHRLEAFRGYYYVEKPPKGAQPFLYQR